MKTALVIMAAGIGSRFGGGDCGAHSGRAASGHEDIDFGDDRQGFFLFQTGLHRMNLHCFCWALSYNLTVFSV